MPNRRVAIARMPQAIHESAHDAASAFDAGIEATSAPVIEAQPIAGNKDAAEYEQPSAEQWRSISEIAQTLSVATDSAARLRHPSKTLQADPRRLSFSRGD